MFFRRDELHQDAAQRPRMQESNIVAARAFSRFPIDKGYALRKKLIQRGFQIFDEKRDVV